MARPVGQHTFAEDTIANLDRLSQKSGVQSSLIISRESGAIVQSSGLEARDGSTDPEIVLPPSEIDVDRNAPKDGKLQTAEDVARIVYNFVKAAGEMAQELNGTQDDGLKLLRLRTKKNELVIVPGMSKCSFWSTCIDKRQTQGISPWSFTKPHQPKDSPMLLRDVDSIHVHTILEPSVTLGDLDVITTHLPLAHPSIVGERPVLETIASLPLLAVMGILIFVPELNRYLVGSECEQLLSQAIILLLVPFSSQELDDSLCTGEEVASVSPYTVVAVALRNEPRLPG